MNPLTAATHSRVGSFARSRGAFYCFGFGHSILMAITDFNCSVRSSAGSFMNSRAAALQAATRFASFHSAMPVTPGGSLRLRGRAIGIA